MNTKKIKFYIKLILLLISFFILDLSVNSQIINRFGIKGGISLAGITQSDTNNHFILDPTSGNFRFLTFDVGLYAEVLDSRHFCVSTELHYVVRGELNDNPVRVLYPVKMNNFTYYEYRYLSDRFHYLSLQILPRYKYIVSNYDKMYIFGGPRIEYRLSNGRSDDLQHIKFKNSVFELGFTVGIGNEVADLFNFEVRYEQNITPIYKFEYGNETASRRHNCFSLLVGVSLKKLLKINL